jgi:hypothetical protein
MSKIEKKTTAPSQEKRSSMLDQIFGMPQEMVKAETTDAENVAMIIKEWLDRKHIKQKTRYTKRQVIAMSILQSLATRYNIKTLDKFLMEFRTNKLSEDGKSSSELENILKARLPNIEENALKKFEKYLE